MFVSPQLYTTGWYLTGFFHSHHMSKPSDLLLDDVSYFLKCSSTLMLSSFKVGCMCDSLNFNRVFVALLLQTLDESVIRGHMKNIEMLKNVV